MEYYRIGRCPNLDVICYAKPRVEVHASRTSITEPGPRAGVSMVCGDMGSHTLRGLKPLRAPDKDVRESSHRIRVHHVILLLSSKSTPIAPTLRGAEAAILLPAVPANRLSAGPTPIRLSAELFFVGREFIKD